MTDDDYERIGLAIRKRIRPILSNPAAFGLERCLLCGAATTIIGVYRPPGTEKARLQGKPEDVCYGLCECCVALSDCIERVEARLFAELSVQ